MERFRGEIYNRMGFLQVTSKGKYFIPLLNTSKKLNSKFTREGIAGAKPRTPPSSAHQIYGGVPIKICHNLFCKSIDRGKQESEIFTKIWGKITQ